MKSKEEIYGECAKHPGNNLANCIHCKIEDIKIAPTQIECSNHIPITFDNGASWFCIKCAKPIPPQTCSQPLPEGTVWIEKDAVKELPELNEHGDSKDYHLVFEDGKLGIGWYSTRYEGWICGVGREYPVSYLTPTTLPERFTGQEFAEWVSEQGYYIGNNKDGKFWYGNGASLRFTTDQLFKQFLQSLSKK